MFMRYWNGDWQIAFKMIELEMGVPLEQVFSKISATPIAAASLGQVYRGTLRSTGEEVAIKVSGFMVSNIFSI
jgi:predicted unusual protein kinase regulating ubiquinone biosynthesis (AarF/ABC1/UbiB family)